MTHHNAATTNAAASMTLTDWRIRLQRPKRRRVSSPGGRLAAVFAVAAAGAALTHAGHFLLRRS